MRAEIVAASGFRCAPEGHSVVHYSLGTIIDGQAAVWAVEAGAAVWLDARRETKVVAPPERKRGRGRPRKGAGDEPG